MFMSDEPTIEDSFRKQIMLDDSVVLLNMLDTAGRMRLILILILILIAAVLLFQYEVSLLLSHLPYPNLLFFPPLFFRSGRIHDNEG